MLESLGYREVPERARRRPDPLQHLLDPREGRRPLRRPPARGQGAQAARPGAGDRRRRLLGAVGQGAGLPPVPVRRRRVRPGPGAQARRVPDVGLADRPGLLRVRGLHRPPAAQAGARGPGVDADLGRLQLQLLLLHRPVHARARGLPPARRAGRGGPPAGRRRRVARSRCSARTSTPTAATCGRSARRSRSCCAAIDAIDGVRRIRYTSPHPKDMREDVIRAHAELASVCEHMHLPLQAGASRILKAMRRTYTRERYLDRVALIREHVPDVALTTDIIVGFPGETEADFRETLEVVEEVGYDGAFTFIFSPRRGTEAADAGGPRPARGEGRAHAAAGRGRPAPRARARPALRRAHGGGARRGDLAHRRRAACAAARATTRSSTSPASRSRARYVDVEIHEATSQTLLGEQVSLLVPAA